MHMIKDRQQARRLAALLWALLLIFGCKATPYVGLKPIYPPAKIRLFALYSQYAQVDSLQPSLQWEPFSPRADGSIRLENNPPSFKNITYELRIWAADSAMPIQLVYQRKDLESPLHKVEMLLEPDTRYLWSVRAHFTLGGKHRTIEWALAGYTLRDETVPNLSCLRFKTPAGKPH